TGDARESAARETMRRLLPVTIPMLLRRSSLPFLAARAALRLQRIQPPLRLFPRERSRASTRRRRLLHARLRIRLRALVPTGRRGARLPGGRILSILGLPRLPHLSERLLQVPLGVEVLGPKAQRLPVSARRARIVLRAHREVPEVVGRGLPRRGSLEA